MRRKVGTALHEHIVARLRSLAERENRSMNDLIEEALERYLTRKEHGEIPSLAASTRGTYKVTDEQFRHVMEEDPVGSE